jgi:hypothetical protein
MICLATENRNIFYVLQPSLYNVIYRNEATLIFFFFSKQKTEKQSIWLDYEIHQCFKAEPLYLGFCIPSSQSCKAKDHFACHIERDNNSRIKVLVTEYSRLQTSNTPDVDPLPLRTNARNLFPPREMRTIFSHFTEEVMSPRTATKRRKSSYKMMRSVTQTRKPTLECRSRQAPRHEWELLERRKEGLTIDEKGITYFIAGGESYIKEIIKKIRSYGCVY